MVEVIPQLSSRNKLVIRVVKAFDDFHWLTAKSILWTCKWILFAKPPGAPTHIIILRNCFFGDFVVAIPALRRLRVAFPQSKITLLTSTAFAGVWRDRPHDSAVFGIEPGLIDNVIEYSVKDLVSKADRRALKNRLNSDSHTVCLALCYSADGLQSRLKRILMSILLDMPFPLGLTGARTLPLQHKLNRWRTSRLDILHQSQAALRSANEFLVEFPSQTRELELLPSRWAKKPSRTKRLIGVAPFTKQNVKQWPIERFAELMLRLSHEELVIFEVYGSAEDIEPERELSQYFEGRIEVQLLCGKLSPKQLRQHLEAVDLLICLDSGPMHVASLVGTPVVAIFPQITLHQFWRPWGPHSTMVSSEVSCAQCDTRTGVCPEGTKACINNIDVISILQQAKMTLGRSNAVDPE